MTKVTVFFGKVLPDSAASTWFLELEMEDLQARAARLLTKASTTHPWTAYRHGDPAGVTPFEEWFPGLAVGRC